MRVAINKINLPLFTVFACKLLYKILICIMGRILGHKRPLTALEIACISNCSMVNSASEAYFLGIAQTIGDGRLK
jgi:uncharacterized membrane protein